MANISYTSVVALNDYKTLTPQIAEAFKPYQKGLEGIQVMLKPENYNSIYPQELFSDSDKIAEKLKMPKGSFANSPQLTLDHAKEMGKIFDDIGIKKIQLHYPWAKSVDDMNWQSLALTINFGDKIMKYSDADEVHINYHPHGAKALDMVSVAKRSGKDRKLAQEKICADNVFARWIKESLGSEIILTVENNPPCAPDKNPWTGKIGVDNFSLIPEDFVGARAVCLDIAHADNVINSFKLPEEQKPENIKWIERQYHNSTYINMKRERVHGTPYSCGTPIKFVLSLDMPLYVPVKWLHICDEPNVLGHVGAHVGDGNVNFEPWAEAINYYVKGDIIATIEVEDAYKPEGLERIAKSDLPKLQKIF